MFRKQVWKSAMRVSRGDTQDLTPQLRTLTDAGCDPIYREEASGG
jgi:hypothetical protein